MANLGRELEDTKAELAAQRERRTELVGALSAVKESKRRLQVRCEARWVDWFDLLWQAEKVLTTRQHQQLSGLLQSFAENTSAVDKSKLATYRVHKEVERLLQESDGACV